MSTEERVIKLVSNFLGANVTKESTFIDLFVDSLDLIEIVVDLEKEFGVHITDSEIYEWQTIGDIILTLNKKVA